jgi:DNA-binding response OmpR family regulator
MISRERVLVAASDAATLEMVGFILIDAGYHVVLAWTGTVAQHRLETFHPTVIVLDIQFQIEDRAALEVLRKTLTPETPIIAIGNSEQLKSQAMELGANEYLVRPFSPKELLDNVEKYTSAPAV